MSSTPLDQSYVDARQEWMERYGSYIAQARTWRLMAFASMAAVCALTIGIVVIAGQSKVRPFVVVVDKLGAAVAVRSADEAKLPDDRIIRFQLANYITNARQVTSDPVVQKRWLDGVYGASGPSAANFLNVFYKDADPFTRAKAELSDVEIQSALPLSKESWQIEWSETKRTLTGDVNDHTRWKAIIKIGTFIPSTESEMYRNPSGVVVTQISWTQEL
jgi:type IV secretion system protein TrbF